MRLLIFLIALVFLAGCAPEQLDGNAVNYDFGLNEDYIINLENALKDSKDLMARGDYFLMAGRLHDDQEELTLALDFYHKALDEKEDWEQKAIVYETIASIDNSRYHLLRAAEAWRRAGNRIRAKMDFNIATGRKQAWHYDLKELPEAEKSKIISGASFSMDKESLVVSQVDMGVRDLSLYQLHDPFSNNLLTGEEYEWLNELRANSIKWHAASGTMLKKYEGKWYAPNEENVFMFEVKMDKALPTARFLREDVAIAIDTHGISMVVDQALRLNATAVIASCGNPGDAKAAKYLGDKGLKVACITDSAVSMAGPVLT